MQCPSCGSTLRDDQRICLQCGEVVRKRVAAGERLQPVTAGVPAWIAFEPQAAGVPETYYGASRLQRVFAAIIDSLILGAVGWAILTVIGGETVSTNEDGLVAEFDWLRIGLLTAVGSVYSIAFLASSWQATPGKKALGLKVVTLEHERITLIQSAGRWLAFQLCFLVVFPLAVFVAIFGIIAVPIAFLILMGDGRSPWDAIAGTRVVS